MFTPIMSLMTKVYIMVISGYLLLTEDKVTVDAEARKDVKQKNHWQSDDLSGNISSSRESNKTKQCKTKDDRWCWDW